MKLSKWNSYIPLGIRSGLIYNSFSDKFVAVKEMSEDFDHARRGEIQLFSENFREQLVLAGALVDEKENENQNMERLIDKVDGNATFFHLIVNPTLDCNFNCWYCYENHIKSSCMSVDLIESIARMVFERIDSQQEMESLFLSFFGGEPFLRYNDVALPLIRKIEGICKEKGIAFSLHFTTNSYLLTGDMIDDLIKYKASFQITLDGGKENHDKTRFASGGQPSFDTIMHNIRFLSERGMHITLRINFTRKNLQSTQEIIDRLKCFPKECRDNISVDYQRVWQDSDLRENMNIDVLVRSFNRQLHELGYRTSNNRIIDHVRNSCYGDKKNEMVINYNGDIFACTARDFKSEGRLGHLYDNGKIEWDMLSLKERRSVKFSKPVCRDCRIAPICGGGCRTKCLEQSHHNRCNNGYTDEDIDNLILDRFEHFFL